MLSDPGYYYIVMTNRTLTYKENQMPIDRIELANHHHLELLSDVDLVAPKRLTAREDRDSTEEPLEPG